MFDFLSIEELSEALSNGWLKPRD